jgi:hypothetical protein
MKLRIEERNKIEHKYFMKCEMCGEEKPYSPWAVDDKWCDPKVDEQAQSYAFNTKICYQCERKGKAKENKKNYEFLIDSRVKNIAISEFGLECITLNTIIGELQLFISRECISRINDLVEENKSTIRGVNES